MKKTIVYIGLIVLAGNLVAGCDILGLGGTSAGDSPRVVLRFESLHHSTQDGVLMDCATSLQTAFLHANGRSLEQAVTSDTLDFEVRGLQQGALNIRAAIISNSQDTLFVGEDTREIEEEDFGVIELDMRKVNPVLQVCPAVVDLNAENRYVARATIHNRGPDRTGTSADTLVWHVAESNPSCVNNTCIGFQPGRGTVIAPQSGAIAFQGDPAGTSEVIPMTIESDAGSAKVQVELEAGQ